MKKSQKKVCGSCRALNPAQGNCQLRYRIKNIADLSIGYGSYKYAPQEPCEKPLTIPEYIEAWDASQIRLLNKQQ